MLAIGAIGTIISAAMAVTKSLMNIGLAVQGLKVLANALMGIAKGLGLIKQERKVEDLGDKALQAEAEGIKPENYETYEAYVKAIDEFEIDEEKSKLIPEEEKIQKGIELTVALTMEHFPDLPVDKFIEYIGKNSAYFSAEKIAEVGKLIIQDGKYINDISKYIDGTEKNPKVIENTMKTLIDIEKKVNPNISDLDAMYKVASIRK